MLREKEREKKEKKIRFRIFFHHLKEEKKKEREKKAFSLSQNLFTFDFNALSNIVKHLITWNF
jgi:hypothetical protein